jgi:hypothetical protein
MSHINIGDIVVIKAGAYNFTKIGSEGMVLSIDDGYVNVGFYKITGHYYEYINKDNTKIWAVMMDHLELKEPNSNSNEPYAKVIRKIKRIQTRRKELGYAF